MVNKTCTEILQLTGKLKNRVAIVGIGNTIRGDDGLGPALINRLKDERRTLRLRSGQATNPSTSLGAGDERLLLIDAGEVPENYLCKIVDFKPDTVLLIDAVDIRQAPGTTKMIARDEISNYGLSTHNSSLSLVIEYISKEINTDILLLGVQSGGNEMFAEISAPVLQTINEIAQAIQEKFNA
ncbi:hydrogenase 3 maturation endopeptidase HyCI [bacterium]|nr:hydrogenase 3 maturation endopeptidase HyCI [bacterium]